VKGQAETTELLTWIGIIVVLIALIPVIVPIIKNAIESLAISSPDVVSKDLASLISISASATKDISVVYDPPGLSSYDVNIENRMITVSRGSGDEKEEASNPIIVDAKGSFSDVDEFKIEKKIEGSEEKYYLNGELLCSFGRSGGKKVDPSPLPANGHDVPTDLPCPGSFLEFTPLSCGSGKFDLLEYYIPDSPVTIEIEHLQGGYLEYFHTYLTSYENDEGHFYTTKSRDPTYFEEFRFDKNFIYHMKDTTWATGPNQNVKCENGDDAFFTSINGHFGRDNCDDFDPDIEGGILHPRCMSVGETSDSYPITIVGFSKKTCTCCKTPYVGDLTSQMTLVSRGSVTFPNGFSRPDVVKIRGENSGEIYYYDKELGFIGFEAPGFSAYAKQIFPGETHCAVLSCS